MRHENSKFILFLSSAVILMWAMPLDVNCNFDLNKISSQQRVLLNKFRARINETAVHDYQKEEIYLIRWLVATKWDLNGAVDKFSKAMEWRKRNKMDTILNETIKLYQSPSFKIAGVDKMGHPVGWLKLVNMRTIIVQGKRKAFSRYSLQNMEKLEKRIRDLSNSTGKPISQVTTIANADGFGRKEHACVECIKFITDLFSIRDSYYPELVYHEVWVHVPRNLKNVVEVGVAAKLKAGSYRIFGPERSEWIAYLKTIIPLDQLRLAESKV